MKQTKITSKTFLLNRRKAIIYTIANSWCEIFRKENPKEIYIKEGKDCNKVIGTLEEIDNILAEKLYFEQFSIPGSCDKKSISVYTGRKITPKITISMENKVW